MNKILFLAASYFFGASLAVAQDVKSSCDLCDESAKELKLIFETKNIAIGAASAASTAANGIGEVRNQISQLATTASNNSSKLDSINAKISSIENGITRSTEQLSAILVKLEAIRASNQPYANFNTDAKGNKVFFTCGNLTNSFTCSIEDALRFCNTVKMPRAIGWQSATQPVDMPMIGNRTVGVLTSVVCQALP